MGVKYYFSTITGTREMEKQQQRIEMVLDSKNIKYEKIDMAKDVDKKKKMRDLIGDPNALPPQLFNDDTYLGDFDAFYRALEAERLEAFLKI